MHKKIDYFEPGFIIAIVLAIITDAISLFLSVGVAMPGIGIFFGGIAILTHFFLASIVGFLLFPKLRHLIPKLILIAVIIVPLPLLSIGIIIAILMQNKFIEAIAIQVALKAIDVAAAPVGVAAEAAAATEQAANAAQGTARVASSTLGAAGEAAGEGAQGLERAREVSEKGQLISRGRKAIERGVDYANEYDAQEDAQAGDQDENYVPPEALGEKPTEYETLERDLLGPESPNANPQDKNVTIKDNNTVDLSE